MHFRQKHEFRRWNNLPLKRKILIIIFFLNTLLFSIVGLFGIRIITKTYDRTLYQSMVMHVSSSAQNLQKSLDSIKTMSNMIYADPSIQKELDYLKCPEEIPEKRTVYSNIYNTLLPYYDTFKHYGVSYISVYADSLAVHTYRPVAQKVPKDIISLLNQAAVEQEGRAVWNIDYTETYGLFLTRAIRKINYMDLSTLGTLNIALDIDKLVSYSTDLDGAYNNSVYLLYKNGENVYLPDNLTPEDADSVFSQLKGSYDVINLNDNHYFAVNKKISGYGLDYICMIPYNSIFSSIRFSVSLYFAIFLLSAIVSLALSDALINNITKHIQKLIQKMNRFRGQNSSVTHDEYDYDAREDEIGVMHQQFNYMAHEIQSLIQVDYENKLLMKDAQLRALAAQINPHFLYNTLESVNWRAKAIGASDISAMVEALGSLFRASLSSGSMRHSIQDELKLVSEYMTIQKLRFEERLTYHEEIDSTLLDTVIPKLTIQPLVENSVRYALEQMLETCHITVRIFHDNENICIQVRNSGSSFPDNLLEHLRKKELPTHGFGIGLINIDDRLKLSFGKQYGLLLFNEPDMAVAQINLPLPDPN